MGSLSEGGVSVGKGSGKHLNQGALGWRWGLFVNICEQDGPEAKTQGRYVEQGPGKDSRYERIGCIDVAWRAGIWRKYLRKMRVLETVLSRQGSSSGRTDLVGWTFDGGKVHPAQDFLGGSGTSAIAADDDMR